MPKPDQGGANPRNTKERTEQMEMHSKDAHKAARDRKPAPSVPAKAGGAQVVRGNRCSPPDRCG